MHRDTLTVTTRSLNIVGAYFPRNTEPENIIDDLGKALENTDDTKPTILMGDLNCCIDRSSVKTQMVIDFLTDYRLKLLNRELEYTYIAPNGRSTIDLIFTDCQGQTHMKIEKNAFRKHLPVTTELHVNQSTQPGPSRANIPKLTRHIDELKWEERKSEIPAITNMMRQGKLDEAIAALTENIALATNEVTRSKRTAKPWFDEDCFIMRQRTQQLLHEARKPEQDAPSVYS